MPRFEASWHHKVLADYGEKHDTGEIQNLMVWLPPRHTKSETFAVRLPAWSIGKDPKRQFMIASYGERLAQSFSRGVRNTIAGPRAQQLFPLAFKTKGDKKWQVQRPAEVDNEKDSMIAGGILGPFTGEGATDLIIDDPYKNKQDAYSSKIREAVWEQYTTALRTRLMPGGRQCIQQTRWHEDDLCGKLIKAAIADKRATQWTVLCLAATNDDGTSSYVWDTRTGDKKYFPKYEALWPAWFPRDALETVRVDVGPTFWAAMYQQAPIAAQGSIWLRSAWKYFDELPAGIERLIQIYDTAYEEDQDADYSATLDMVTVPQLGGFALLDGWRDRVPFPQLLAMVYARWERAAKVYGRYPERLLIENKGSGISLRQQLEANNLSGGFPLIPVLPMPAKESKVVRSTGVSGYQQAGMIWLPRHGTWTTDFVDETAAFPKGTNDDWNDCLTHGLTYYTRPVDGTEHEEVVAGGEEVHIDSLLDEFDIRSSW